MAKNIKPDNSSFVPPEVIVNKVDTSEIYARPKNNEIVIEDSNKNPKRHYRNIIQNGVMIALAPAVIFTVFLHIKNNGLDALLLFFCTDIALILLSLFLSYRASRNFIYEYQALKLSSSLIISVYLIAVCGVSRIMYLIFVHLEILFAYLLLPISITLLSGVIFWFIVKINSSKFSHERALVLTILPVVLVLVLTVVIR